MKKLKKIIVFVLVLSISLFTSSCFSISTQKDLEQALEYMAQFEHSENIVYYELENLYKNGQSYNYGDLRIIYATNEKIYFVEKSDGKMFFYKSDYGLTYKDSLCVIGKTSSNISMSDSDTIIFEETIDGNDLVNVYHISTGKLEMIEKTTLSQYRFYEYDESYSYRPLTGNQKIFNEYYFEITNKQTNEIKKIDKEDYLSLMNVEQAKKLDECLGIKFYKVCLQNNKIYIQCSSNAFFDSGKLITTYLYDFETETFSFVDWVYMSEADPYITYISET